jgi:hypothetical protein
VRQSWHTGSRVEITLLKNNVGQFSQASAIAHLQQ